MIICNDFIVLNFPKSGSTFVREMIKEIYKRRHSKNILSQIAYKAKLKELPYKELLLPNFQSPNLRNRERIGQHGAYCQIPIEHIHKPILTVARNPYELFMTSYKVKWWSWFYPDEKEKLQKLFPNFPELKLNEYIQLSSLSVERKNDTSIGLLTVQFIRMYFKEPEKILENISEDYINSNEYKKDIAKNITFIKQEHLNEELANYLLQFGFKKSETDFIRTHIKVNETKHSTLHKEILWTNEAIDYVKYSERFLFKILSDYGFSYNLPILASI